MIGFLIRLAVSAGTLLLLANFSNGQISVNGWVAALLAAFVLGLANALVKPILMFILGTMTLPLSCLTLGLWSLVLSWLLNAALFLGVAALLDDFNVQSFGAALVGALVLSVVNAITSALTRDKDKE